MSARLGREYAPSNMVFPFLKYFQYVAPLPSPGSEDPPEFPPAPPVSVDQFAVSEKYSE
jgi:hypothetical protein